MPDPALRRYGLGELHVRLQHELARNPFPDTPTPRTATMRIADGADVRVKVGNADLHGTVKEYHGGSYTVSLPDGRTHILHAAMLERMNPHAPRIPA